MPQREPKRNRIPARLCQAGGAAALALSLILPLGPASGLLGGEQAHAASGSRSTPADGTGPAPAEPAVRNAGQQPGTVEPGDRAPFPSSSPAAFSAGEAADAPDAGEPRPSMREAGRTATRAACSPGDFAGRTGQALVDQITSSTTECINTLFSLTGSNAHGAFREEQMVTVADALRAGSAAYPGDGSTGMPQLVLYLRAGYYVHWYNEPDVGEYGPKLTAAIQGGLDAFFGSEHAWDVTDANGETLSEAVILIDSAEQNARYLDVVQRLLKSYDSSYNDKWWMLNAVNNVYTVLWRGHQVPAFVDAVRQDPGLLDTMHAFARDHIDLLGGEQSYLTSNAGRELGRFLQHTALRDKVRPLVKDLLGMSEMTGPTAQLWVGSAEMADAYDNANCSYYGVCDLQQRLRDAVLTDKQDCSASIAMTAQDMAAGDFSSACSSLNGQDTYFHDVARDQGPVKDDKNTSIEVVVFDSSTDYQTYAGVIFGIDTNNGGMYLEGDPAADGNQPRFIAYEADWLRPDFQIWNLNHEYTHYLDGRFNMYGDFQAGVSTPTIWWIEGFAEYVSYGYRGLTYDEAVAEAGKKTYALSQLFDTTYENGDTARIYRWGYLAVRYMYERHPGDVQTVLSAYRAGDWDAARSHLKNTIGSSYDNDWYSWLDSCANGGCAKPAGVGAGAGAGAGNN